MATIAVFNIWPYGKQNKSFVLETNIKSCHFLRGSEIEDDKTWFLTLGNSGYFTETTDMIEPKLYIKK